MIANANDMAIYIATGDPQYDDDGGAITRPTTCGICGRTWDDARITSVTPAPAARCPFEPWHRVKVRKGK